jgi:hypothetical protein
VSVATTVWKPGLNQLKLLIKVTGDPRILKLKKNKLFNFLVARK